MGDHARICAAECPLRVYRSTRSLLQVLYLDVQQGDGCGTLKQLAATTREHFSSQGLVSDDSRPFTPHVTIAKLSNLKSYSVRKRLSRIPEVSDLLLLLARAGPQVSIRVHDDGLLATPVLKRIAPACNRVQHK